MRVRRLRMSMIVLVVLAVAMVGVTPPSANAQTPFVPYFGKNQIRFFNFDWKVYTTEHFDLYYYTSIEPHLERIASYAENAYDHISTELKQDLPERIPVILYKTQSEFQTNNVFVGVPEGVLAFAEPERRRMVLPIDEPPDQLYRLITHELTHVFEFEIIPRGLMGGNLPLWMDEGLANYMAGYWNTLDLMQVRDAALSDNVPRMSQFETEPLSGRLPYSLGHAAFEFIESRWGKEGLRQFLFSLRKGAIGSGESAYKEALKVEPEEFDDMFDRYLKERFKPFRDKERPMDYGRNIAPKPERTNFASVLSLEASPSGDMIAAVVGNSRDYELDIALLSAKDGQLIENLTKGFDHRRGIEYIATAGGLRGNMVPWIAWAPVGDTIAYFARTGKVKALIIQNVATGRTVHRLDLGTVDGPESPAFSPDGKRVAFAGLQNGITDIFAIDIETGVLTNLTNDPIADFSPAFAPDGRTLVYSARVSSNDKLFQLDLASGQKRQLTFGTHDDTGAKFYSNSVVVFTSTAIDPAVTIAPEVARNASIPNVWTLDVTNGRLQQLTDTMSGNVSPVVLRSTDGLRVAFIAYYKGEERIHTITGDEPIATVASSDFGEPGPLVEFTPQTSHKLVPENIRAKSRFERLNIAGGLPPIALGVTTGGNFYGNTQITFTDLMGDHQFSFFAQSVSQYRSFSFSYLTIEKRLQWAVQGFSQDLFYFGQNAFLYDPSIAPFIDRDLAEAVQSQRGATLFGIYPVNKYTRAELFGGYVHLDERYNNPVLQQLAEEFQVDQFGAPVFRKGHMLPLGVSLVRETTVFREFGPVAGNTFKVTFSGSPAFNDKWLGRRTLDVDLRHYQRLVANGVLALRLKGFKSWGPHPDFLYFGGNSEMRGYEYLQFLGHKAFFANAELRFPIVQAVLTPFGVMGGMRGVFFFNVGGAGFNNRDFRPFASGTENIPLLVGYEADLLGNLTPVFGPDIPVSGIRLVDSQASYGLGLTSSILGFPIHFDWSWKTLLNRDFEDVIFFFNAFQTDPSGNTSGSQLFRKVKFQFWIGYDF
jgi:WD40 repeat protein